MAPRRSSRLRDSPTQETSDTTHDGPAQAKKGVKRKSPTGQEATKSTGASKRAKKPGAEVTKRGTTSNTGGTNAPNLGKLSSLSPEILNIVRDEITDKATISALMRTSKALYALMAPRLYHRVAVAAMFHAHIAKVIRTLEPHLTIEQKKQLKKEGKYKGQQEKYPTGLDQKKIPVCAGHVRQLIIGASDPGKKHKYIVDRYYEEALKNLANLEIVETLVVNKSICEGIAALANLKALIVNTTYLVDSDEVLPLARIKNLKHLELRFEHEMRATGQSLIRNSMTTLQSLEMLGSCNYFQDWEKNLQSSGHSTASKVDKGPDFPALRSLHIQSMEFDEKFSKAFSRAVDLSKLRKLTFTWLHESQMHLWSCLTDMITSYKSSKTPLSLRTLSIDMNDSRINPDPKDLDAQLEAQCQFVSSFDTLTTLKLSGYGQYREDQGIDNPGLSDTLLQAILVHKDLRVLHISYGGKVSGLEIPYLGAKPIGDIIDGLPLLRELEFAPDEPRMDEISRALCRGKNLELLTCFPHESWVNHASQTDPPGINILASILSTFMSNAKSNAQSKKFVWEDYYKLRRQIATLTWDIASKFGKRKKGYGKPEMLQVDTTDGTREVWYQTVPQTRYIHVGYDPLFEKVEEFARQLD